MRKIAERNLCIPSQEPPMHPENLQRKSNEKWCGRNAENAESCLSRKIRENGATEESEEDLQTLQRPLPPGRPPESAGTPDPEQVAESEGRQ